MVENFPVKPRLLNLRAPLRKTYLIAFIPIFWFWIFLNLVILRPKVIHACDLDTVLPCYFYKFLFRKRLVFDVCDRFAMAYISPKFKMLYSAINLLEELFARKSDALITVAERLLDTFRAKPKHTAVIMNCAEEDVVSDKKLLYDPMERAKMREEVENKEKNRHVFTMVYTGNIVRSRGLEKITAAIKDLHDVKLLIAGKPIDKNFLHTLMQLSNVQYKGLLQSEDALALDR
jgi:glycosyltransferase involved in cell wall biosynthesis